MQHPQTELDVKLRELVSVNKRQPRSGDVEWFTLSTLRSPSSRVNVSNAMTRCFPSLAAPQTCSNGEN